MPRAQQIRVCIECGQEFEIPTRARLHGRCKACRDHGICGICGGDVQRVGFRGRVPTTCPGACRRKRMAQLQAGYRVADPRPRAVLPMNVCVDCHSEFEPTFKRQGGTKQPRRCPSCSQVWEVARVKRKDARRRIRRHGLTAEQYDALLARQGGTCAICDRTDDGAGRMLHIDHDHDCCPGDKSCGRCVRGLLCARHNVGIGYFNNDPEALYAAIAYLTARRLTEVSA